MASTIRIDAYRQYTRTIYDRQNLSIIDSQRLGKERRIPLYARQYLDIFRKAFVPNEDAAMMDNATVATLGFNVGWLHLTFTEVFPGNTGTINTTLENVLTVPLQWSVTAYQFINYTSEARDPNSDAFAIPDDMLTVARGGKSVQRLAIQAWTGWVFIVAHMVILLFVLGNIIWIMGTPLLRDDVAGVPELDNVAMAGMIRGYKYEKNGAFWRPNTKGRKPDDHVHSRLLDGLALEVKDKSSWKAMTELRRWRLRLPDRAA
jgi:hypothetical protein